MTSIKTGKSLQEFLQGIIDESLKSKLHHSALQEKEKQNGSSNNSSNADGGNQSSGSDIFSDDNGGPSDSNKDDNKSNGSSKTSDDETAMKKGTVTADEIVEKLNSIRAGKSFKDDQISSSMSEYIESMSDAERTALFAFLKGIAQIVTGEVQAKQATSPESKPADVTMKKGADKQHKVITPNVIKTAAQNTKPKQNSKGTEDTSSPAPITPKKR